MVDVDSRLRYEVQDLLVVIDEGGPVEHVHGCLCMQNHPFSFLSGLIQSANWKACHVYLNE